MKNKIYFKCRYIIPAKINDRLRMKSICYLNDEEVYEMTLVGGLEESITYFMNTYVGRTTSFLNSCQTLVYMFDFDYDLVEPE